jgi:hypothetical protein
MAKNESQQRSRRWTRRSEKPIRYGTGARFADWWCASWDARKGLPELPADERGVPDSEIPTGTPHMSFLGQQGLERIEKEWIVYQAEVADPMADFRDLQAKVKARREELAVAQERLGAVEAASAGSQAVTGETGTNPEIVAQRRAREHGRKRDDAQATVHRLTGEINRVEAEVAQVKEQIEIRLRIAQRRAAMIEAHIRRRRAAYETRLVRKHPHGRRLNRLLRPGWPAAPEWATTSSALTSETTVALGTGGN